MNVYYINSKGQKISFTADPYQLLTTDMFEYEWDTVENGSDQIIGFERKQYEKEIKVDVFAGTAGLAKNISILTDLLEADIFEETKGTLWVNGHYIKCAANEMKTDDWENTHYATLTIQFITDEPFWIREKSKDFVPGKEERSADGFNYPYNYPYNYAKQSSGSAVWNTGLGVSSCFELLLYGPCVDPRVMINGHPYEVYDTIEQGEYVTISNINRNKIIKYRSNGTTVSLFDLRAKESSVFEMIPPGQLDFHWSGAFGFTLKLYERRSAPEMEEQPSWKSF